jgi:hypothetical protein
MSEYHMDINGKMQLEDYSSIYDYMAIVNKNDNLTITIDTGESENADIVCNMLKKSDFIVNLYEKQNNGKYYIRAYKDNG